MQSKISLALGTDRIHDSHTNDYTINTHFTINIHGRPNWRHVDYFIFFMFPLVRILPRLMRKLKAKNDGKEQPQESYQQEPKKERSWMPKFERESFFEEEKPDKKDGWLSKGDFK